MSKQKIGSPFCPITEADARRWYKANYLNTPGYILAIQRITVPPGAIFAIANIKEFCAYWSITRSAFYRAIDVLKENNECPTIETSKAQVVSHDRDTRVPQAEHACPTIETPMSHDRDNVSHERDTAIYNERARAQRSELRQREDRDLIQESDRKKVEPEQSNLSDLASQPRSDRNSPEVSESQKITSPPKSETLGSGPISSAAAKPQKFQSSLAPTTDSYAARADLYKDGELPAYRISFGEFHPEMIQAVFLSMPELYSLPGGKPNEYKIISHLKNLERKGQADSLFGLWKIACAEIERKEAIVNPPRVAETNPHLLPLEERQRNAQAIGDALKKAQQIVKARSAEKLQRQLEGMAS